MTDDLYDITVSYSEADIRQIASWTRPSPFADACRAKVAELDAARIPVPEKGTRWRNSDDGWVADFTTGIRISSEGMLTHQSAWPLDGSPGIYLSPDWQERWSEIPPRGCPEIGEVWELTTTDGRTKRGTVDGYKRGDHGWRVVLTGPGAPITGITLHPDGSLRCPNEWHRIDPEPEPARPEWALWTVDTPDGPAARDSNRVMVLAGHLKVGDVISWWPGEWQAIESVETDCASHNVKISCRGPNHIYLYIGSPVVVRVGEDQ